MTATDCSSQAEVMIETISSSKVKVHAANDLERDIAIDSEKA